MASKHTLGPWWVESRTERVVIFGDALCPREVASFLREADDDEARMAEDADARLIAAAPDLLAALRDMVEEVEEQDGGPCVEISTTHGGETMAGPMRHQNALQSSVDAKRCRVCAARAAIAQAVGTEHPECSICRRRHGSEVLHACE